jgi:hypothetical protein
MRALVLLSDILRWIFIELTVRELASQHCVPNERMLQASTEHRRGQGTFGQYMHPAEQAYRSLSQLCVSQHLSRRSEYHTPCEGWSITYCYQYYRKLHIGALFYKPEGRGFNSRIGHSISQFSLLLPAALWP